MQYLKVNGGKRLGGEIDVHGAKNSVLPILASTVLIKGESVIHNCPKLSDVEVTVDILKYLGAKVKREGSTLMIDTSCIDKYDIPEELMLEMRSSIIFLGALASRAGKACLYLPGGCEIGLRPIDLHLKGLESLSYETSFDGRNVCCFSDHAQAGRVVLSFPSVGATENVILASVMLEGKTTIVNAAREPEIVDLCCFLNSAGAKINGASTPIIEIEGVRKLMGAEHRIIPDRILAATLMCAAAMTSSEIRLNRIAHSHLIPVYPVFDEAGCEIFLDYESLIIRPKKHLRRVKEIKTGPYPCFPTDCQALCCAMLSVARGVSIVQETIFENRMKHIPGLLRFGADINAKDRLAVINGVGELHSADVICTDLRGGASFVLAALCAEGTSVIKRIDHIDRGYENIETQLSSLGADIMRMDDEKKEQ